MKKRKDIDASVVGCLVLPMCMRPVHQLASLLGSSVGLLLLRLHDKKHLCIERERKVGGGRCVLWMCILCLYV